VFFFFFGSKLVSNSNNTVTTDGCVLATSGTGSSRSRSEFA